MCVDSALLFLSRGLIRFKNCALNEACNDFENACRLSQSDSFVQSHSYFSFGCVLMAATEKKTITAKSGWSDHFFCDDSGGSGLIAPHGNVKPLMEKSHSCTAHGELSAPASVEVEVGQKKNQSLESVSPIRDNDDRLIFYGASDVDGISRAEIAFRKSILLDKTHIQAAVSLSDLLVEKGHPDEALVVLTECHREVIATLSVAKTGSNKNSVVAVSGGHAHDSSMAHSNGFRISNNSAFGKEASFCCVLDGSRFFLSKLTFRLCALLEKLRPHQYKVRIVEIVRASYDAGTSRIWNALPSALSEQKPARGSGIEENIQNFENLLDEGLGYDVAHWLLMAKLYLPSALRFAEILFRFRLQRPLWDDLKLLEDVGPEFAVFASSLHYQDIGEKRVGPSSRFFCSVLKEISICLAEIGARNACLRAVSCWKSLSKECPPDEIAQPEYTNGQVVDDFLIEGAAHHVAGLFEMALVMYDFASKRLSAAASSVPISPTHKMSGRTDIVGLKRPRDDRGDIDEDGSVAVLSPHVKAFKNEIENPFRRQSAIACNKSASLMELCRFQEARSTLKSALEVDPLNPHLLFNAGCLELLCGSPWDSVHHLKNALEVCSSDMVGDINNNLGLAFVALRKYNDAIDAFNAAIECNADAFSYQCNRAHALGLSGNLTDAEKVFRKLLAQSSDGLAQVGLSQVLISCGKYSESIRWAKTAISVLGMQNITLPVDMVTLVASAPTTGQSHNQVSQASMMPWSRTTVEDTKTILGAHLIQAECLLETNRHDEALDLYRKCVAVADDIFFKSGVSVSQLRSRAHCGCALAFMAKGSFLNEALGHVEMACQLDPENHVAWRTKGTVLFKLNCVQQAVEALERCISLNDKDPYAMYSMGEVLFSEKKFDEALKFFSNACTLFPSMALFRNYAGIALAKLGRQEEALATFAKSSSMDLSIQDFVVETALNHLKENSTVDALKWFKLYK